MLNLVAFSNGGIQLQKCSRSDFFIYWFMRFLNFQNFSLRHFFSTTVGEHATVPVAGLSYFVLHTQWIILYIYIYVYFQWEFQNPKMEVLYHIRQYFVVIFPYIGLIYTSILGSWNSHWYFDQIRIEPHESWRFKRSGEKLGGPVLWLWFR